jgi:hypothetical protein
MILLIRPFSEVEKLKDRESRANDYIKHLFK